jgi:hypothetical protein
LKENNKKPQKILSEGYSKDESFRRVKNKPEGEHLKWVMTMALGKGKSWRGFIGETRCLIKAGKGSLRSGLLQTGSTL